MEAASRYGRHYYIYLVDSAKIEEKEYTPMIICDPLRNLKKGWIETIEKIHYEWKE